MTGESSFFLDSNVWLYALSNEDDEKAETASTLVKNLGERIRFTTQVVNEVCVNLKRKSSLEGEIRRLIDSYYLNYTVV